MKLMTPFIFFILTAFASTSLEATVDTEKLIQKFQNESSYQDVLIHSKIVVKGWGPECEERYEVIKKIASQYDRPITVLDIGAGQGYFSFRLAEDFDSTVVMIDHNDDLQDLIEVNDHLKNVIYLKQRITAKGLENLAKYEHFDIVLVSYFLHHVEPWKEYLSAALELGDHVIVETPSTEDIVIPEHPAVPEIFKYLSNSECKLVEDVPRYAPGTWGYTFIFNQIGNEKFRTSWNTGEKNNTRYYIKRDYGNKYRIAIDENGQEHSYELKKGINFRSLIQFKGVHPMLETLRDSILEYSKAHPGEIYAGNTLVNGYELMPCDPDFLKYYSIDSSKEEAYLHAAFKSEEKREKKRNYKH